MKRYLLLAALVAAGCSQKDVVVVYSPHGPDVLGDYETLFEEAHPEVDVQWLYMGSQEVYDRIRSEAANPQADIWFGGPDTIFARGAAEGLLQAYKPAWADKLPEESQNADQGKENKEWLNTLE